MTPARWQEIQRLFAAARALPEAERAAYLARACAEPALAAEVLALLASRPAREFLVPPPLDEAVAGRELGEFSLVEEIGRGGMGVVYKARQGTLERFVAVKVLPANLTLAQRQVARFQREARSAARLHHPGVASIFTVGEDRGTYYFAMEYVSGRNLADELLRLRADLGAEGEAPANLPSLHASDYFSTVAEIVRQAADALQYAHDQGVVHRDVKPSNLILDAHRNVKIVDFGLARDEEMGSLTTTAEGAGTPHYMSPEQARHQSMRVDHRTDVYSLGVVLFELLTLARPFEGTTSREVIDGILQKDPPRIRGLNRRVPRDLETICVKAMAKNRKERYADAAAFRDDLARFLAHEAIHAQPPSFTELFLRRVHKERRGLATAGIGLAAGALGIVWALERAEGMRLAEIEEEVGSALTLGELSALPVSRALELRAHAQEYRSRRPRNEVLAADPEDPILRFEQAFDAMGRGLRETGEADLAIAKDVLLPDGVREFHLRRGMLTLLQASHLFPDDTELARLCALDSAFPTLAVAAVDEAGNPVPARVFLRAVDVLTTGVGERAALGTTPLSPTPVRPGYYRVVVVFDSGGFREFPCNFGLHTATTELVARRHADESAIEDGMIRFEAGAYTFADHPDFAWSLEGRSIVLSAFLMDPAEVSNAEYHRFVEATGHPRPFYWESVPDLPRFLADFGDRPVVGVGYRDALAYAAWRGKRLPTAAERALAAGGRENRAFPYRTDDAEDLRGNVFAPLVPADGTQGKWQEYLAYSAPVRSHEDARTPEGLYHMYGNVFEFTESMMVEVLDEDVCAQRPFDRITLGSSWHAAAWQMSMQAPAYWGIGEGHTSNSLGFRCAKSVEP